MDLKQLIEKLYILEQQEKLFIAEYTNEAEEQLLSLEDIYYDRITTAIKTFELIGTKYLLFLAKRVILYLIISIAF